jgi:C4-dicarboxylate transporter DctM subunit
MNVPIAVSLGLAASLAIIIVDKFPADLIAQLVYAAGDSYSLISIPFFMLAGSLMELGGLSKRLINFCDACVGHVAGGLGVIAIITSMFFAAISGSGPATVAALGGILIPAMVSAGYNKGYSAALMATSGAIGIIIPPSIPMIVYAVQAEVSVGTMFMSGFIPGILYGIGLIVLNFVVSKKNNYKGSDKPKSIKEIWQAFKEAFFALLMPFIILGGIYGGVFTATEAAGISVVYGFIIGMFVYKELKVKDIPSVLIKAGIGSAVVIFIVMCASVFSYVIVTEALPVKIVEFASQYLHGPFGVLLLINIILLIAGCFLDATSAIIVLVPLLLPLALSVNVNPVHFGIIMVVNLAIGLITPPVGLDLFVACNIAKINISEIVSKLWWLLFVTIAILMLITYIPSISLILPRFFGAGGV